MRWYTIRKKIKGRWYLYRQHSWRDGGAVRTESWYIGPYDGSWQQAKDEQKKERWQAAAKTRVRVPVITTLSRLDRWRLWLKARREFSSMYQMMRDYNRLRKAEPADWRKEEAEWQWLMDHLLLECES